jgi:hypothetical protein
MEWDKKRSSLQLKKVLKVWADLKTDVLWQVTSSQKISTWQKIDERKFDEKKIDENKVDKMLFLWIFFRP